FVIVMACETFTILTLEVFFLLLMLWATPQLARFPQHRWGFNILRSISYIKFKINFCDTNDKVLIHNRYR
ncbi:MAG: hypothetical protein IJV46_05060, partial [Acidaminococcaceae bacterium]|nr:hypothetical protein [Acidaminococcaceae bacterium]